MSAHAAEEEGGVVPPRGASSAAAPTGTAMAAQPSYMMDARAPEGPPALDQGPQGRMTSPSPPQQQQQQQQQQQHAQQAPQPQRAGVWPGSKDASPLQVARATTVSLRGLPTQYSEADVLRMCKRFGAVVQCVVQPGTGGEGSSAQLEFTAAEAAGDAARTLNGIEVSGMRVSAHLVARTAAPASEGV
ncbi:MAG: hypothetical protein ACK41Y_16635, partial [Paracoccus hibiscisoli]|uniref:hypothetical protein n=1 Tax=Paracoccus hibiscisoli TaxID=2023261 RepID=UPI00391B4515